MPRMASIVILNLPHRVAQRGNMGSVTQVSAKGKEPRMWYHKTVQIRLVLVSALLAMISLSLVSASHDVNPPAKKKESAEGPLRPEILVLLDKTPATLLFRATNAGNKPVTVERFRYSTNYPVVIMPDGKEVNCIIYPEYFGMSAPKTSSILQPGESKEWEFAVGNPLFSSLAEPGTYRISWKINGQTSSEVLLFRKEAAFRKPDEKGASLGGAKVCFVRANLAGTARPDDRGGGSEPAPAGPRCAQAR